MKRLEKILDDCLDRLTSGEATLEDYLKHHPETARHLWMARYPEQAGELRRLIGAATKLEAGRDTRPSQAFKMQARARLVAYMRHHPRQQQASWWAPISPIQLPFAFSRAFNLAVGLAAIIALFLTTGTVLAQTALPGDPLYRWKLTSEHVLRTVYPYPLTVDLMVAERRTHDLRQVIDDPQAREVALHEYQQTLARLSTYTTPEAKETISQALVRQKDELEQANFTVPELEKLLASNTLLSNLVLDYRPIAVEPGRITYSLTVTNSGIVDVGMAAIVSQLAPEETLVSASDTECSVSNEASLTCVINNLPAGATHNIILTAAISPCYSGRVVNSAAITHADHNLDSSPAHQTVVESEVILPYPGPAQIVYVQSNQQSHSLGLVSSTADLINDNLHVRAAAPAWSPDGTKLAFFGEQGISELGEPYNRGNGVWVVDIVKGQVQNPEQLVAQDHIRSIAWSPNGRNIAFEVGIPKLPHEIVVIDASDGRELSRFSGEQPAWRPDSQKLAIKSCNPGCGLWLVDLDGDGAEQLTFDGTDSYPAWSPDGQDLAFSSQQRDGNWEIYRLRLANRQLLRLTHRPGTDTTPFFGPCGQEIYLRTDEYGSWWITAIKLNGSDEYKIREGVGETIDWGLARPAVH